MDLGGEPGFPSGQGNGQDEPMMKRRFPVLSPIPFLLSATLLLVLVAAACDRGPRLAPLGPEAVVLAFGDSLTFGTGAAPQESYPAILSERLGRRVINAGVPGEISSAGLARLPRMLEEHRPDLVILIHGGNDFLRRLDPAGVEANLKGMVDLCRASGAEVVLVGVPQLGLFLSAPPLYGEIAGAYGIPCEVDVLPEILADRSLKSDPIHPNAAGYARLADVLARLIAGAQR